MQNVHKAVVNAYEETGIVFRKLWLSQNAGEKSY